MRAAGRPPAVVIVGGVRLRANYCSRGGRRGSSVARRARRPGQHGRDVAAAVSRKGTGAAGDFGCLVELDDAGIGRIRRDGCGPSAGIRVGCEIRGTCVRPLTFKRDDPMGLATRLCCGWKGEGEKALGNQERPRSGNGPGAGTAQERERPRSGNECMTDLQSRTATARRENCDAKREPKGAVQRHVLIVSRCQAVLNTSFAIYCPR